MQDIIREKLAQTREILRDLGIDCWITFVRETEAQGDPILPFLLGHPLTWQSALILTRAGERIAIVGKYEDEAVRSAGAWTSVVTYVEGIRDPLRRTLEQIQPRRIALNYSVNDGTADGLSHGLYLLLADYLADTPFVQRFESAEGVIGALRGRKSPAEVARIRAAIAATDEILRAAPRFARPGRTEVEVQRAFQAAARRRGLELAWEAKLCPMVTTGPESMVGHGLPSRELSVRPGKIFHIDFGVRHDGYCSDIQRSWYVPETWEREPPSDVQRGFDVVRRAILAAAQALRPGAEGWQVDAAARRVVVEAGYPEYEHATGHQVGRAVHDGGAVLGPRWERYGRTPFYPIGEGSVFTLEPGVEVEGRGYLGLEEMVLVTGEGVEWLTTPQESLWLLSTAPA